MFLIVIIVLIILLVPLIFYTLENSKNQLKNIDECIESIENNPNTFDNYDKFIEVWKSSTLIQAGNLFNGNYYDRSLKICEKNPSYINVWQILREVLQRIHKSFGIDASGKRHRSNTFRLFADSLFKEFNNQLIREQILSLIHLISGITQTETQDLYKTSLKILEANPSSQEAKMLVLDLGRLHYSILRPEKKPTIYDEQAIQNDIIVRSK